MSFVVVAALLAVVVVVSCVKAVRRANKKELVNLRRALRRQ